MTKIERVKELLYCSRKRARYGREQTLPFEESPEEEAASVRRRRELVELADLEVELYDDLLKHYEGKGEQS